MIDFLRIEAAIRHTSSLYIFGQTKPFVWRGIRFVPQYDDDITIQSAVRYTGFYAGLRIALYFNKIRIENSLHKFYKENNHSDFSRKEINKAIKELCQKFDVEADNWEIIKLEFGFNVRTPLPAKTYVPLFLFCKKNMFQDVMWKNKCFERKCFFAEYAVKAYDKSEQFKLQERITIPENLLRIEVCYLQKRRLPEGVVTLADLQKADGIKSLYEDFEKIVNQIVFNDEYNYTELNIATLEEKNLFFASLHPDFLKVINKINHKEQKETKVKIRRLRERFFKKDFKRFLEKSLKDKYIELYCS